MSPLQVASSGHVIHLNEKVKSISATFYEALNTFTAIVDLSRSNFSIVHAPLFQLKSAM